MQFTLFGVCTVNLLLSAQVVQGLLVDLLPGVGYCLWFIIFAAAITPPMWLGSPKDFWFVECKICINENIFSALISNFQGLKCLIILKIFCKNEKIGIQNIMSIAALTEPPSYFLFKS